MSILDTHCTTFESQFGRSQLFSNSLSSAARCPHLASSASSGRGSWAFSHQLRVVCLRWGYCLHFFASLQRRLGIVALQSAAAVIAVSNSLRAAVIWDRFRAASSTVVVTGGFSCSCPSSSRRSIALDTSTALVRAPSILTVTASPWREIPSNIHVSHSSSASELLEARPRQGEGGVFDDGKWVADQYRGESRDVASIFAMLLSIYLFAFYLFRPVKLKEGWGAWP